MAYKISDNNLYVFLQRKEILKTSEQLYAEGVYDNVIFIDSNGCLFKVHSVERLGWGTLLAGYSFLYKGRAIKIEFNLEKVRQLNLEEFKEIVYSRASSSLPYFAELEAQLIAATTYEEVIQTIK